MSNHEATAPAEDGVTLPRPEDDRAEAAAETSSDVADMPAAAPSTGAAPKEVTPADAKPPQLHEWFDRVFVINCAHRPDRLLEFQNEIDGKAIADLSRIRVYPAVIGDYTTHPAGFGGGNGAWGCILPENRVQGRIRSASKARYSGDAVRLVTRRGARVTVTVNHPILTEHGFVRAGDLRQGINLLGYRRDIKPSAPKHDIENHPPLVGEMFDALKRGGLPARCKRRSPLDFYGDGEFLHGDIDIVDIDGSLPYPGARSDAKGAKDDVLLWRHQNLPGFLPGFGSPQVRRPHELASRFRVRTGVPPILTGGVLLAKCHSGATQHAADTRTVGVAFGHEVAWTEVEIPGQLFYSRAGSVTVDDFSCFATGESAGIRQVRRRGATSQDNSFAGKPGAYGVGTRAAEAREGVQRRAGLIPLPEIRQHVGGKFTGSGRYYSVGPAADLDACIDQLAFESVAVEAELFRKLAKGSPGVVEADELVYIERFHYEGDVFDFGTTCGYFTISHQDCNSENGIIVSNCLQSHRRIFEDLMHERDERGDMTWRSALILEDDVFFLENALEQLQKFMQNVPQDWGQLYLGGQHRMKVTRTPHPGVVVGNSVNRTHAYAISSTYVQAIYRHVSYMMDYNGNNYHIDHQLERAHQRHDWPVYCPDKWICGQRAGSSNVSGKTLPAMVWQ
jgi:hypothetical protein